jgi:DNA-binding NarL/FixJ family response regulator
MAKDIKVLLVDDHELVRRGLRRMLELEEDMEVVGDAGDAEEAYSQVEMLSPDVVVMDIKMPGVNGVEATRVLKERNPSCKVIMLTLYEEYLAESMESGADGYLLKDAKCTELTEAIRQVCQSRHPLEESGGLVEEVDLVIPPPADTAQVLRFISRVGETLDANIRQTIGSHEWGTNVTVLLQPAPLTVLLHKLRSIPNVEEVEAEEEGEQPRAKGGLFRRFKAQPKSSPSQRKRIRINLK